MLPQQITGAREAADVAVANAALVEIAPESLVSGRFQHDQYVIDIIAWHTGFEDDGVTPGTNPVYVLTDEAGEPPSDESELFIDTTHTQDDPWTYQGLPVPGNLFFTCDVAGGATIRVRKIVRYAGSSKA